MTPDTPRCSVCGIPLRPSQILDEVCVSPSCRHLHRLRRSSTIARRCLTCGRAAVPPQETCDDPRCRRLKADNLDARKREAERTVAIDRLTRKHERELRDVHGAAVPERILIARLPANEQTTIPLPHERRAAFAANLAAALDRAMEDPDRPVPESPESPAAHAALTRAACTACRGSCCKYGGDRAYLYPDHFRRYLRDHPGRTREDLLAEYLSLLPPQVYHDSCVYHTDTGCALPRDLRSNLCNTFLCGGLSEMLDSQPKEGGSLPVLACCFRDHGADLVRSTAFDAEGRTLVPEDQASA